MKFLTSAATRWSSQGFTTQCMTSPTSALRPIAFSSPGQIIDEIGDFWENTNFAQSFPIGITMQARWNACAQVIPPVLSLTTSRTRSLVSDSVPGHKLRLKRPEPQDWDRWRHSIMKQYREESAPRIVDRLRREGYHVTVKMLRDRLRAWGANTKNKHAIHLTVEPFRTLNTPAEGAQQHQLLLNLNRWHDLWWERRIEGTQDTSPDINVLYDFCDLARAAVRRDNPSTWRSLRRQADEVASVEWSKLTPLGLLRLASRDACFAPREKMLSSMEGPWVTIITKSLPRGHPIMQLIRQRCHTEADLWIWHALLAMHESKVRLNDESERRETTIARARVNVAAILIQLGQQQQADEVLHPCTTSPEVEASANARDQVYYMLGQSSYFQGDYERAAECFWRVKEYACGGMPSRVNIANQLAKCLLWSGDRRKAHQVLQEVLIDLQAQDVQDPGYEAEKIWLSSCVENMIEDLSPLPEFGFIIARFRRLDVISFNIESVEPKAEAETYHDKDSMEALTLAGSADNNAGQMQAAAFWPPTNTMLEENGISKSIWKYNGWTAQ